MDLWESLYNIGLVIIFFIKWMFIFAFSYPIFDFVVFPAICGFLSYRITGKILAGFGGGYVVGVILYQLINYLLQQIINFF